MHKILLFTSAFFGCLAAFGTNPSKVIVGAREVVGPIGRSTSHYVDSTATMPLDEVVQRLREFQPSSGDIPRFGLTKHAHWLRFTLKNESQESSVLLAIPYSGIDELDVYLDKEHGFEHVVSSGLEKGNGSMASLGSDFVFELPVASGTSREVLVRMMGFKHLHAPINVGTTGAINESRTGRLVSLGLYIGIMTVLFMYNFFVYISTRDKNYLLYILSIVALSCTQLSLQGQGPFNHIHINGWITSRSGLFFNLLAIPLGYEFARGFISTRKFVPRMDRWVPLIYVAIAVIGCVYLFVDPWIGQEMGNSISGIAALYLLTMGIIAYRKGSRQARFFLLAWTSFLIGVILFVLKDEGVIGYTPLTVYAMPIGSAIEGILLSFGLADRINVLRREKEQSQAEALAISQENERIIREQNIMLESKVRERTHALQESNEDLKRTQTQLVNAEKMASLGQLTAGIAHEINNPINFITSNVEPLRRNIADIVEMIEGYRGLEAENTAVQLAELHARAERMGLQDSISELDDIIASIAEGSSRTAEIVRGLRNFSRLGEDDLKDADLNEGLRSTLTVLGPQYRDKVSFSLELGDIPKVECFPGKVNQVFMNILTNAAQATIAHTGLNERHVRVRTYSDGEHVTVCIADNGTGMSEEVKAHIFDPFFTTKPVGEGTGLGMAIVYGIVQDHQGRIDIETMPGAGTEFRITLPLRQQHRMQERA